VLPVTVIVTGLAPVNETVLLALAAAYAPAAPSVRAPAAIPAASFTFVVIANMLYQVLLE
jgi:hypothetical protein